jgi:UDP-2,3-diacylglucosamine pyrophosphatase LpxH
MKKKTRAHVQRNKLAREPLPPPPGFRVRKVAQRGDGSVLAVQSVPEGQHRASVPDGHEVAGVSTLFGSDGAIVGQWVKSKASPRTDGFDFLDAMTRHVKLHVPAQPLIVPPPEFSFDRLNVFVWGDPHIGLLAHARETGANFDLKIATAELRRSADLLVAKAPCARHALFVEVGDLWHAQDDTQRTPRGGNKLDVDGRKSKILEEGLAAVRHMLDALLASHETVTAVFVPGNHDPDLAIFTRVFVAGVYANEPRLTVLDNADPWIYHEFGQNLFLFNHGDKRVKPQELGEMMLADVPHLAGRCKHRTAITGHVHHKNVQEFRWGRWESFNSLCASDFWHHSEGYRSERLAECITYDARYGEAGRVRLTHEELTADLYPAPAGTLQSR